MKRLLQVLTLGAAALLFTAANPGIAAADNGRGGGHGGSYQGSRPYKPYLKPYEGHRNYGQYRREQRHRFDRHRRHHYRDYRRHRRHDYYGHRYWRRHHDHWYGYGFRPYIGLHFYPSAGTSQPIQAAPPAYPVQPAVIEQPVVDAGAPSSCLMTREYQTEIVVGGELVPGYGQACLQPDGSWYRGPAVPVGY